MTPLLLLTHGAVVILASLPFAVIAWTDLRVGPRFWLAHAVSTVLGGIGIALLMAGGAA